MSFGTLSRPSTVGLTTGGTPRPVRLRSVAKISALNPSSRWVQPGKAGTIPADRSVLKHILRKKRPLVSLARTTHTADSPEETRMGVSSFRQVLVDTRVGRGAFLADTLASRAWKLKHAYHGQTSGRRKRVSRKPREADFNMMKDMWAYYDADMNGHISMDEFKGGVAKLDPVLAKYARSMFMAFDDDSDGVLTFEEFFLMHCPWMTKKDIRACINKYSMPPPPEPEQPRASTMDEPEILTMFQHLSEEFDGVPAVHIDKLLKLCPEFDPTIVAAGDEDGNGVLDFEEFRNLMVPRQSKALGGYTVHSIAAWIDGPSQS
eukprot:TRINITY_DN49018_c0_g2_i2.p1 TRINITY_DN49018_c0_g2~~TRINITY_DN49018_c0_g2_i2.p1  ORF type:complete len:319 (+),score=41.62 TRINITY_DN49018_c0_g2_i2:72-1028(+)